MIDPPRGLGFPMSLAPPNSAEILVTDAAFGATDDGLKNFFVCTWQTGQKAVTAYLACLPVTLKNTGPDGNGQLTFPTLSASNGISVGAGWCGKPIAITGAGILEGVFTTTVLDFRYDSADGPTVVLSDPVPLPLHNSIQQISCPCFVPGDVGKVIWLSNAACSLAGSGNPTGPVMKRDTIVEYRNAFQITLGSEFTAASVTTQPGTQIIWGTDNSPAVRAAGKAALASGRQAIYFRGWTKRASTGLFCLFDWITNNAPVNADDVLASHVTGALMWFTSDSSTEVFITSKTGADGSAGTGRFQETHHRKMAISVHAPRRPHPRKDINGGQSLRRCSTLSTIVAVLVGDSWALENSAGTNTTVLTRLKDEIQRQNPGKVIRWVYRGIGGYKWEDIVSSANIPRSADLKWITGDQPYLHHIRKLVLPGMGAVSPDLVICMSGGANDGVNNGTIWPADIDTFFHIVAGWDKANGYPPDVIMVNGATKSMEMFVFAAEFVSTQMEYVIALNRSYARVNRIPFIDLATTAGFVTDGWTPDRHVLRAVPPLKQGVATCFEPYSIQYQTRDFWVALQLIGTDGPDVWSRIGTLSIQLSPKPDNRLLIEVDRDKNLTVSASTWGGFINTQVTIEKGTAKLSTCGQKTSHIHGVAIQPNPPSYAIAFSSSPFSSDMVGQCLFVPKAMPDGRDFRTMISGYTNGAIIFASDATPSGAAVTEFLVGGHMFTQMDASAQADVTITSDNTTLISRVVEYHSNTQITLRDIWDGPSKTAAPIALFVGRLSVLPSKDNDVAAGSDQGANPTITIEKRGTRVKIGYVLGSAPVFSDTRDMLRHNERIVWEGDVVCFGGPFVPRVWTSNATPLTAVNVQAVFVMLGEREVYLPELTIRDAWGVADNAISWPYGGDTSHPSSRWVSRVVGDTIAAQDFSTGCDFSSNFGIVTPTESFDYTIPDNQGFTKLDLTFALASGSITLPKIFPQGGRLEVFSTNCVASLTMVAPHGRSILGAVVSEISPNRPIAYCLIENAFCRTK